MAQRKRAATKAATLSLSLFSSTEVADPLSLEPTAARPSSYGSEVLIQSCPRVAIAMSIAMTNATVPKSLMGCISSAVTRFSMQLQPKRTDDFKDGVEAWATITGERFVETFTRESGIARNL